MCHSWIRTALAVTALGLMFSEAAAQPITFIQLSSGGAGGVAAAYGVNDARQIVGQNGDDVGVFWASPTSEPIVLQMGGYAGGASDINNLGQIVGFAQNLPNITPLFWASPSSVPIPLSRGSFEHVWASGINDQGQIVGFAQAGSLLVPLVWTSSASEPSALPLGGYSQAQARGINNLGHVVGWADGTAVFWPSQITAPAALPGNMEYATGINDAGQIVGQGSIWQTPTSEPSAFYVATSNVFCSLDATLSSLNDFGDLIGNDIQGNIPFLWISDLSAPLRCQDVLACIANATPEQLAPLKGPKGDKGDPGPQGSSDLPTGTLIFLEQGSPSPAGFTLLGRQMGVTVVRDVDGTTTQLRIDIYRKN